MRAEVREALDNALDLGSSTDFGGRSRRRLSRGSLRAYVYAVLVELTDFTVMELVDELCINSVQCDDDGGGIPSLEDA